MIFHDRRCLRLSKTFIFSPESLAQRDGNVRLCFGYFDALKVECLPSDNDVNWLENIWLQEIRESKDIAPELYKHPLFIMAQGDKAWKNSNDAFWHKKSEYLLVSLAHFVNVLGKKENTVLPLVDRFTEVKEIISNIVRQHNEKVQVSFYHSIDLSDMVIIWKTDYLNEVMKCLKQVYMANVIGSMHTICSFSVKKSVCRKYQDEELLDFVSFRFSVKNANAASCFFSLIRQQQHFAKWFIQKPFLTIGSEDIDFVCHNIAPSDLQDFMYEIFENKDLNDYFKLAFNESLTHIGIILDSQKPEKEHDFYVDENLSVRCQVLFHFFKELRKKLVDCETEANYSWMKLVSVQLNTLINMSQLCVLDRFCYLMLDSVQSFCEIFEQWVYKGVKINSHSLTLIQKYVRSWGILMDQTVRTDGQFTQNIGVSPAFYDIPISLLEFYSAFTRRCITFLQSKDKRDIQNYYALFLMPNLCRRTKVQDVFRKNEPPTDRLLYVDIPLDYLYKPRLVIFQLCHEISHYCGDSARCRESRKDSLTEILSLLTAQVFQINDFAVVRQIQLSLNEKLTSCSPFYYLKKTIETLLDGLQKSIRTGEWLLWIDTYVERRPDDSYTRQNMRNRLISNAQWLGSVFLEQIQQSMQEIFYLYNEGYADISMIYLLRPSYQEYMDLYQQEIIWLNQDDETDFTEKEHKYWLLAQRVALVTQTISKSGIWECKPDYQNNALTAFIEKVNDVLGHLRNQKPFSGIQNSLPCGVLLLISDYLDKAYKELTLQYDKSPELENIRRVMETVTKNFSDESKEYQETISLYENSLLQKNYWIKQSRTAAN